MHELPDINKKLSIVVQQGIAKLGIRLTESSLTRLLDFISILLKWNRIYNLTAIRNPEDIVLRHILDSFSIVPYIKGARIIDVGTGAGFPGIPCALALPDHQFILLDSNGKKTRFLTYAVVSLGVSNVEVVQARVEKYAPSYCFNTVTARAFAPLENIIVQTRHLCCAGGQILVMKGRYPAAELEEVTQNDVKVYKLDVPGLNEQRHLVCIEGIRNA
jgi:16S rRNA (guanine527-N7)-methyltransferase